MMFKFLILLFFYTMSLVAEGQIKAKAIAYTLSVDLATFAPDYADQTESEDITCTFEVDLYYNADKVKTIVRSIIKPSDYDLTIRQRLYDIRSRDEYNIDHAQRYMLLRKDQAVKPVATKRKKDILGYPCKEYVFTDYRGVGIAVWVTDKLPDNLCPAGNFSLKGTTLEVLTSNGLHYIATDFAEGVLDSNFFHIPEGYQQEVISLK